VNSGIITKTAEEIGPGDMIMFLGQPHLVWKIEEYTGPFDWVIGIARSADGWGITLGEGDRFEVAA
jgi:hypothetical protein